MKLLAKVFNGKASDRSESFTLLRRILVEQGRKHWRAYAAAYGLMAITAACTAGSAYIIGHAVNLVYTSDNFRRVIGVCLGIIAISVAKGLAAYGQTVVLASTNADIAAEYRVLLFAKMLRQSLGYFSSRHTVEVNSTINFSSNSIGGVLTALLVASGRDVVTLFSLVTLMILQSPLLSLACSIVMPIGAITVRKMRDQVRHLTEEQIAQSGAVYETGLEALQGMRVVKSFGMEDYFLRRFGDAVEKVRSATVKIVRMTNRSSPLAEAMGGVAVALLFLYGSFRVASGALPGETFSFVAAFLFAYEPLKRLSRLHINLSANLVGVRILYQMLDTPDTELDDGRLPALEVTRGDVEFKDVVLSYRPNEPVLRSISFAARGGKLTALVGRSGGGKSTIFNLLLRLYGLDGGSIVIDGQNITTVSRASVRRNLAYVGQDSFLFRGTIRENILVGKPNAAEEEIRNAAEQAFAHGFISSFPRGYDSPVGEHGVQLSTGQRQRIAIARALITNAPIILLDESTASLDYESEREVQAAIARVCEGRTTIVIAHRLHTVVNADCIYVVEDGKVVESGQYDELICRGGRFSALSNLQSGDLAA